jgi:hypothetical protein
MTKTPRRLQLSRRNMRKLQALGLEGALRRSGWDGPVPADGEYGWFLVAMCQGWVVWPEAA